MGTTRASFRQNCEAVEWDLANLFSLSYAPFPALGTLISSVLWCQQSGERELLKGSPKDFQHLEGSLACGGCSINFIYRNQWDEWMNEKVNEWVKYLFTLRFWVFNLGIPPQIICIKEQPSRVLHCTPTEGSITDRFQKTVETEIWEQGPPLTMLHHKVCHPHRKWASFDSGPHFACYPLFNNCWWNQIILHEKNILYNG